MRRLPISLLLAAFVMTAATTAAAQGVYKYTDANGRVVYTDDPKANGGRTQRVEEQTSVISAPPVSRAREGVREADVRSAALDRAVDDIAAATNDLRVAEERRVQGVEPLEGERQGRRYRPEYFDRQQALQRDVDAARNRLNAATERRNALR